MSDNDPYPPVPDLEKAKALMQEAGVKTPDRRRDALLPRGGDQPDLAQQLRVRSEEVGLNMSIKGVNSDNYYQSIQDPKNKDDIAIAGWEADFPDAITYFEPLLSSGAAGGGSNYGDFKDPAFDTEVARINEMPPDPERRAEYGKLSFKHAAKQAPWITF